MSLFVHYHGFFTFRIFEPRMSSVMNSLTSQQQGMMGTSVLGQSSGSRSFLLIVFVLD